MDVNKTKKLLKIIQKNYYLYIYDYCNTQKDKTPTNFYTNNNNESNTWNYNLKYEDTTKTESNPPSIATR